MAADNALAVTINGIVLPPVLFEGSSELTVKKIVSVIDTNAAVREQGIDAFFIFFIFFIGERSFVSRSSGAAITVTATVTGGASQPVFTATAYTSMKFVGVARYEALSWREGTGFFPVGAAAPARTWGKIAVPTASGANPADKKPAYSILAGEEARTFTDGGGNGNYDRGCFFRGERLTDNLALIEPRGMK